MNTDEIVLEDIFEIGEQMLAEGVDPGAVACLRAVLESFHERHGFFPHVAACPPEAPRYVELNYSIENYYWDQMRIFGSDHKQQIIGWCDYKGKVGKEEDGEIYYEPSEYWFIDADDYVRKMTRRTRREWCDESLPDVNTDRSK